MLTDPASPSDARGPDGQIGAQNGARDGNGHADHARGPGGLVTLAFASIGVVYGDIGTSPLYALRESLVHATQGGTVTPSEVIGVVSMLIWALFVVVTLKYVVLLMRADNRGEGGILALMAVVQRSLPIASPLT